MNRRSDSLVLLFGIVVTLYIPINPYIKLEILSVFTIALVPTGLVLASMSIWQHTDKVRLKVFAFLAAIMLSAVGLILTVSTIFQSFMTFISYSDSLGGRTNTIELTNVAMTIIMWSLLIICLTLARKVLPPHEAA